MVRIPQLRPHQQDAIEAITNSLADGGRAQVVMATGTGKTLVGRAAAVRLLPDGGTVAVLVPSLALVFQTLRAWRDTGDVADVLAVCSADDPGEAGAHGEDSNGATDVVTVQGLSHGGTGAETTTDPARIAEWLGTTRPGPRLLVATYHSVPRIADAFKVGGDLRALDLVVFDEAHRAAADPEAPYATALHDDQVPAVRRLFLTATPRLHVGDPDDPRADQVFPGMSDEKLFGPRIYELSVAEAIERGLLSDYRVVVVGVTDAQVHKLVMDNAPLTVGPKDADARTIAGQIALAQAARSYDLQRILVFHNRVATSRAFTAVLPHTLSALPGELRPDGRLTARHVDAAADAAERRRALDALAAPETGGWTVVSNVRVLNEGVDCPALDAVVFADPRKGQISTIQAVGRALRLHPERDQPAVILIPVYLAPGENGDLVAQDSDFRSVWQILRALRDHDGNVGAQLIGARRDLALQEGGDPRPILPDWLHVHLPSEVDDAFLTAFSTRLLDGTAHIHEHGMGRLLAFVQRHGHAGVEKYHVDDIGFRLGGWVTARRREQARGVLDPGLAAELETLPGWLWNVHEVHFDRMVNVLRAYAAEHGNTHPPSRYKTPDGDALGSWVTVKRRHYRDDRLNPQWARALEQVPGWTWLGSKDERWEVGLEHLRAFVTEFGHSDIDGEYRSPDGFDLGEWVTYRRVERRQDQTSPDRIRALESVPGWSWTAPEAYRYRMLAAIARYYAAHDPDPMPKDYRPDNDPELPVGRWLARRRSDYTTGRMTPELAGRFEEIPGFSWGQQEAAFGDLVQRLADYAAEHGTPPPAGHVCDDGLPLGRQLAYLRKQQRSGKIPQRRAAQLEQLPGWTWEPDRPELTGSVEERFDSMVSAMRAYAAEHGTCVMPQDFQTPDGRNLSLWALRQRGAYRKGQLTREQIAAIEEIPGWYWDYREHTWQQGLARLQAYVTEHGTADVARGYVESDGYKLGSWVGERRSDVDRGRITPDRAAILQSLPGWRWK